MVIAAEGLLAAAAAAAAETQNLDSGSKE